MESFHKRPEDRTAGEVFAAHCASYVLGAERGVGHRHVSYGDRFGDPIGLYSPAQLTSAGRPPAGARFMCDLAVLAGHVADAQAAHTYHDACTDVYDLLLERNIK